MVIRIWSSFLNGTHGDWLPLTVFGKLCSLFSFVLLLVALTEAFDKAFESIQIVRKKIKEKLFLNESKQERMASKFLLSKIEELRPMNACGFFGIEKSTLTSMLSIRYFEELDILFFCKGRVQLKKSGISQIWSDPPSHP